MAASAASARAPRGRPPSWSPESNLKASAWRRNWWILEIGGKLTPANVAVLKAYLETRPNLTELRLRHSLLDDSLMGDICDTFVLHPKLRGLRLLGVGMGDRGVIRVANELRHFPELDLLNLGKNRFGDEGLITVARVGLPCVPKLTAFNLQDGQFSADALEVLVREGLTHCPDLKELRLGVVGRSSGKRRGRPVSQTKAPISHDAAVDALTEVILQRSGNIRCLHLRRLRIGAATANSLAESLRGHVFLWELSFRQSQIGDAGAVALAQHVGEEHTLLQVLDLTECGIGDAGAEALAEAIKKYSKLRTFLLGKNTFSKEGFKAIAASLIGGACPRLKTVTGSYRSGRELGEIRNLLEMPQAWQKSRRFVMAQHRFRCAVGSERFCAGKVLIAGRGNAGKTCLVNALVQNHRLWEHHFSTRDFTDGMKIVLSTFENHELDELRFYDFGGQSVYKASHRLWMGSRAVHLIVWNPKAKSESERQSYEDYARDVLDESPDAKLLFVSTHRDIEDDRALPEDEMRAVLASTFKQNFGGYWDVDLRPPLRRKERSECMSLRALREDIKRASLALPDVRLTLPKPFGALRRRLEGMSSQVIQEHFGARRTLSFPMVSLPGRKLAAIRIQVLSGAAAPGQLFAILPEYFQRLEKSILRRITEYACGEMAWWLPEQRFRSICAQFDLHGAESHPQGDVSASATASASLAPETEGPDGAEEEESAEKDAKFEDRTLKSVDMPAVVADIYDGWGFVKKVPRRGGFDVVLRPSMLASALAEVITADRAKASCMVEDGYLFHSDIPDVWAKYPPELHEGFLRLIHDYGLGFPVEDAGEGGAEGTVILPMIGSEGAVEAKRVMKRRRKRYVGLSGNGEMKVRPSFRIQLSRLPRPLIHRIQWRLRGNTVLYGWWHQGSLLVDKQLNEGGDEEDAGFAIFECDPGTSSISFDCFGISDNLSHVVLQAVRTELATRYATVTILAFDLYLPSSQDVFERKDSDPSLSIEDLARFGPPRWDLAEGSFGIRHFRDFFRSGRRSFKVFSGSAQALQAPSEDTKDEKANLPSEFERLAGMIEDGESEEDLLNELLRSLPGVSELLTTYGTLDGETGVIWLVFTCGTVRQTVPLRPQPGMYWRQWGVVEELAVELPFDAEELDDDDNDNDDDNDDVNEGENGPAAGNGERDPERAIPNSIDALFRSLLSYKRLTLLLCPDLVREDAGGDDWEFEGLLWNAGAGRPGKAVGRKSLKHFREVDLDDADSVWVFADDVQRFEDRNRPKGIKGGSALVRDGGAYKLEVKRVLKGDHRHEQLVACAEDALRGLLSRHGVVPDASLINATLCPDASRYTYVIFAKGLKRHKEYRENLELQQLVAESFLEAFDKEVRDPSSKAPARRELARLLDDSYIDVDGNQCSAVGLYIPKKARKKQTFSLLPWIGVRLRIQDDPRRVAQGFRALWEFRKPVAPLVKKALVEVFCNCQRIMQLRKASPSWSPRTSQVDDDAVFAAIVYEEMGLKDRRGGAGPENSPAPVFELDGEGVRDSVLEGHFPFSRMNRRARDQQRRRQIRSWLELGQLLLGPSMAPHFVEDELKWDTETLTQLLRNGPVLRDMCLSTAPDIGGDPDEQKLASIRQVSATRNHIMHQGQVDEGIAKQHHAALISFLRLLEQTEAVHRVIHQIHVCYNSDADVTDAAFHDFVTREMQASGKNLSDLRSETRSLLQASFMEHKRTQMLLLSTQALSIGTQALVLLSVLYIVWSMRRR